MTTFVPKWGGGGEEGPLIGPLCDPGSELVLGGSREWREDKKWDDEARRGRMKGHDDRAYDTSCDFFFFLFRSSSRFPSRRFFFSIPRLDSSPGGH